MQVLSKDVTHLTEVSIDCINCGTTHTFTVNKIDYHIWQTTKRFIQDVMPYLKAWEREMFISRICGKCFDNLFKDIEE